MNVTEIYCDVDDFCILFLPSWEKSLLPEEKPKRKRSFVMSASEDNTHPISWFSLQKF